MIIKKIMTIFIMLFYFIAFNSYAEYYVSCDRFEPPVVCINCVKQKVYKKHTYKKIKKYHAPKHYVKKKRSSVSISVYYVWYGPSTCDLAWMSPCCCYEGYKVRKSSSRDYVTFSSMPASYYPQDVEEYDDISYDTRTGDDDVDYDADMNNQY